MWTMDFLTMDTKGIRIDLDGLLEHFQWLKRLEDIPQDPVYHGEGHVLAHTFMVLDRLTGLEEWTALPLEDKHTVFTAALFHDVGKWFCTRTADGKIVSPRHALKGAAFARITLWKGIPEPVPFRVREAVAGLVRFHSLPLWLVEREDPQRFLIRLSQTVDLHLLSILAEADVRGRISADRDELLDRIALFREEAKNLGCYGKPFPFPSSRARFEYCRKTGGNPFYEPYDGHGFEVILMSGMPGAGKDTWISSEKSAYPVISLDRIRKELKVSPSGKQHRVISTAKDMARDYLRQKQSFIWNATNITRTMRKPLVELFASYGATVRIVYIEPPHARLLKQNRERMDRVPDHVMAHMMDQLEVPTVDEAHQVDYIVD